MEQKTLKIVIAFQAIYCMLIKHQVSENWGTILTFDDTMNSKAMYFFGGGHFFCIFCWWEASSDQAETNSWPFWEQNKSELTNYRKDTEHLYHAFVYSLVSHFFPVSILQCIHCLLHQTLEISICQGVHITYFKIGEANQKKKKLIVNLKRWIIICFRAVLC